MIVYPTDNPYNQQNKGKRKPFTKPTQTNSTSSQGLVPHANQVTDFTGVQVATDITAQIAVLHNQMSSIMESMQSGSSSSSSNFTLTPQILKTLQNLITVKFSNENAATISKIGSVTLYYIPLVITDVLYISFTFNLIYVSKVSAKSKAHIHFTSHECIMQDQHWKKYWILDTLIDGLYQLNNTHISSPVQSSAFAVTKETP